MRLIFGGQDVAVVICSQYREQFTLYTEQLIMCIVYFTLCIVQFTLHILKFTLITAAVMR